ncbi:MAG: glutamine amidotransferase [Flavobacteriales bacterium]|nr:glutamine amidotransferase [Flavobacteriales bacterium]
MFFSLLLVSSCTLTEQESDSVTEVNPLPNNCIHAAFLIMDGTYNSELTAPFDVFQHTKYREVDEPICVSTIAQSKDPITTFEGLHILPDYSYSSDYPDIDILVIPAAEHNLDSDLEDDQLIGFIRETAEQADWVLSLCDGAFILAKTGLLNGLHCTTYPGDRQAMREMFPECIVHDSVLWVHHDKFITSAGGAKSFEPAMYLVETIYSADVAEANGIGLVIDWDVNDYPYHQVENP